MNMTLLIAIAILQVIGLGVIFMLYKKSTENTDQSELVISAFEKSFSDLKNELTNSILNQGKNVNDSLLHNNERLTRNFSELREGVLTRLHESQTASQKDLFNFREMLTKDLEEKFFKLSTTIETRLDKINNKVQENLNEGFKKTNETFTGIIQRLAKIDEAQKKIDALSTNVISLQDVLTDKKSRGIFGEVQLTNVLKSVFGEPGKYYELQHKLDNTKIVDAALMLPEPVGLLCVDSKFPLENFKRMYEGHDEAYKLNARKEFAKNIKKHVDDISSKYIIKDKTSDQAIMFLPAEAIFAEIHAYHPELVEYAQSKRVWITGPSTFMATLTTVQTVLLNMERSKYMSVLHKEINKLGVEFSRYEQRWDDLQKHLMTVTKDADKIHVTTGKISKQFQKIMEVEIEGEDPAKTLSNEIGTLNL